MDLSAIHHIAIIASDYRKAKDFYAGTLGFAVVRENYRPERGDWKIDLRVNETTELELFIEPDPPRRVSRPEAAGLRHLAFYTGDVEAAAAELRARGVAVEPVRVDEFSGGKFTFFFDPDGLPLELHE